MDHSNALATQAAERYLLGELPADEAEEFESHYFECPQCALAVESGDQFIAAVREGIPAGAQASPNPQPRTSLWDSMAAFFRQPVFGLAMAALLAAVAIYQGTIVIPGLQQPRALPAFQLIGASRTDDQKLTVPAGSQFISLSADIPPEFHFRSYLCKVFRDGKEVFSIASPPPDDGHPVAILVPADKLKPGKQELRIFGEGADGNPISTYPFDFQTN